MGKMAKPKPVYVISPENAGNTALLWTCSCGESFVNFPYITCHKCGEHAPSRQVRDEGGTLR